MNAKGLNVNAVRLPCLLAVLLIAVSSVPSTLLVEARRSSGGGSRVPSSSSRRSGGGSRGSSSAGSSSRSRRRQVIVDDYDVEDPEEFDAFTFPGDDYDDEEEEEGRYDDDDLYDDEYDMEPVPRPVSRSRGSASRRSSRPEPKISSAGSSRGRSSRGTSSSSRGSSRGASRDRRGNVVTYESRRRPQPQPSAFTRGITALRQSIPDPSTLKENAASSMNAVRQTSSKLSSNLYREIKGLTSSELEQVMLKATGPNDTPVKGKHVERLVGVTYQISGRYDIYDAVLRKLWSKMVEKDWRTNIKALYILHRFSADGAPDHQAALKARLRELRRTRDPKRKEKYFNSKLLLSGDTSPATANFRAFLARYAHYVLLRAQCFGGMFAEIANDPNKIKAPKTKSSRSSAAMKKKSITSTCLKNEHLEAAQMLLKAGLACELKEDEECENTAIAVERVASDLIGLTTAVATALNNALKGDYDDDAGMDWALVKKWCEFYSSELLVQSKGMVKRVSPTLDAYGMYLPSRMGTSVSPDLLQKGMKMDSGDETEEKEEAIEEEEEENVESSKDMEEEGDELDQAEEKEDEEPKENDENEYDAYDEYEYEEYEYE